MKKNRLGYALICMSVFVPCLYAARRADPGPKVTTRDAQGIEIWASPSGNIEGIHHKVQKILLSSN